MNYPESSQILEKIKSSDKILLNFHHNPDADSVGSAISLYGYLTSLGKNVKILSPSKLNKNLQFLIDGEDIETPNYSKFGYSEYDLFITTDSSSWSRVTGARDIAMPEIFIINIDHHKTNQKFGNINLVIPDASANSLIIYKLLEDFELDLTEELAKPLLTGIMGDTGGLRFPEADAETYEAALQLLKHTDKNEIIFNLFQSYEISHVNVWREIMQNLKIDQEHGFAYSFVTKDVMERNGFPDNAKAELADMIIASIEGTNFGMVGAEADGYISVSFRARKNVDVAELASTLGGGGHKWASAARVWEGDYQKSVEKVLESARKFSKNVKKG